MYCDYHTHTPLCLHASGTPQEYVRAAARAEGLEVVDNPEQFNQLFLRCDQGIELGGLSIEKGGDGNLLSI